MPQQLQQFLIAIFPLYFVAAALWVFACMGYLLWRRKIHGPHFPDRTKVNIRFEECWASGNSHKSLFTRMGGGNNCLRVTVTDDELWVTPHFPFNAFAALFDLDHRVRQDTIVAIEPNGKVVQVRFARDDEEHMVTLRLRNADRFCDTLEGKVVGGENNA